MSKKDKLYNKLFSVPSPKDFTWQELLTIMQHFDCTASCKKGGSHYTFEHKHGFRFQIVKSHPGGILKTYQVEAAKEAIKYIKEHHAKPNTE